MYFYSSICLQWNVVRISLHQWFSTGVPRRCQLSNIKFYSGFFPEGTKDCNFKPGKDAAKYFTVVLSGDMNKKRLKTTALHQCFSTGRSHLTDGPQVCFLWATKLFWFGCHPIFCINFKQKHIKVNLNCFKAYKNN